MSQFDDDDSKPWTEHDLKEAIRRINAGEINFKEAEDYYGISPRTIHRQRAIENMRAQLNPEKAKKAKQNPSSSTKKDVTVLRKPVDISCTSISDVVTLLDTGTEEVKQLLNYECDLIYECKVCKNLFRSLVNFISHKRVYCCDMYSVLHTRTDDGEDGSVTNELQMADKIKSKENVKEFTAKPFRITCRKDLTSVLKRITSVAEFAPTEPILKFEHLENSPNAYQQSLVDCRSSDHNDSTKSVSEQLPDNVETSPEAESKTETTAVVPKIPEKLAAAPANSSGYVAEKRFRCPVCAVNFTIKKSVMRHLKAVHNQSPEQMERLKPRIQMHYVRRKTSVVENKSSPPDKKSSPAATKSKPDKEQNKSSWEKTCATCNRLFINRNSFAAHSRACQRHAAAAAANQESSADSSRSSRLSVRSLQPVVALTPLAASVDKSEKSSDSVTVTSSPGTHPDSANNKPPVASPSRKMENSLPALSSASSSTCKKIGIQVRMNYGKANASPAASSTGVNGSAPSSTFPSAPLSVASAANSRRSSFAAPAARSDDQTISGLHSSTTRSSNSGAVLAHILETLLDKKGLVEERTVASTSAPTTTTTATVTSSTAQKSTPSSDAKKVAADKEGASQASAARKKLHNCDFKSNDKRQLLPQPDAKHATKAESELTQVQSTFVAERRGSQSECHGAARKKNANDKTDASATALPRKTSLPNLNTASSASQTGATSKSNQQSQPTTKAQPSTKAQPPAKAQQPTKAQPQKPVAQQQRVPSAPTLKRKLTVAISSLVQSALPAKRKPLNVRQSSTSLSEPVTVKTEPANVAQSASAEATPPVAVKRDNSGDDACAPATQTSVVVKKSKKTPVSTAPATISTAPKTPTPEAKNRSFPRIKIRQTPDKPLLNGIGSTVTSSSSDEENDLPPSVTATAQTTASKAKSNVRKQCDAALIATEQKPTKTPPSSAKIANCNNDLSSSSSTPDSDLDPSTLTEENLKKSIMTIIFGKDIPTEKLEEREKSPTSSCTSSDSGKEKRYSVRIAKQSTSTKNIVAVGDCRDDKVTKIAIPPKVKATR